MRISLAICTHNEGYYIRQLLQHLTSFVKTDRSGVEWEIVVLDDFSTDPETVKLLDEFKPHIHLHHHALNGNYAEHKNELIRHCTGDWILNLDADEMVTDDLLGFLPLFIDTNPHLEVVGLPRINTVEGLTMKHIREYGWVITKMDEFIKVRELDVNGPEYEMLMGYGYVINTGPTFASVIPNVTEAHVTYYEPIIMYPDYQLRLFRNKPEIRWINKVHERLVGHTTFGMIPPGETSLAILHHKEIKRQEKQNAYYATLQR